MANSPARQLNASPPRTSTYAVERASGPATTALRQLAGMMHVTGQHGNAARIHRRATHLTSLQEERVAHRLATGEGEAVGYAPGAYDNGGHDIYGSSDFTSGADLGYEASLASAGNAGSGAFAASPSAAPESPRSQARRNADRYHSRGSVRHDHGRADSKPPSDALAAISTLAEMYAARGDHAQALRLQHKILAEDEERYGHESELLLPRLDVLAQMLDRGAQPHEALCVRQRMNRISHLEAV
jgi:hypothetical protein